MANETICRDQLWESRDRRDDGRQVRVLTPPALRHANDFVEVENVTTGRRSRLRELTLTRRYRPVEPDGAP